MRRQTEIDGLWGEKGRKVGGKEGWSGKDSLAYAGTGTLSLPCSGVLSPDLPSPFVLQKYPSGWEGVCEKDGESCKVMTEREEERTGTGMTEVIKEKLTGLVLFHFGKTEDVLS